MAFRYLTQSEITEVYEAALSTGLMAPGTRNVLLAAIDPAVAMALPVLPAPQVQLLSDLGALNGIPYLADGSVPLQTWLDQAITLSAGRVEADTFRQLRDRVGTEASGQGPTPEPAQLSEVVNNEVIVHQDDMLTFGFLAQGALAGRSVAKVLVPRVIGGAPQYTSTGKPSRSSGTGWLLSPDLLVTNHHVLNARLQHEPDAAEEDLRRQAAGTVVQFDFDAAGISGTEVTVERLEAWDPLDRLDFAVLRLATPIVDRAPLQLWPHRLTHMEGDYRPVNIIQHPRGEPKSVAFRNNLVTAADATTIRYFTDTDKGSSGSPVFDDAWNVVALHRGSREVPDVMFQGRSTAVVNFGTLVTAILDHLQTTAPALHAELVPGGEG